MTTKLEEKVKMKKKVANFNERLAQVAERAERVEKTEKRVEQRVERNEPRVERSEREPYRNTTTEQRSFSYAPANNSYSNLNTNSNYKQAPAPVNNSFANSSYSNSYTNSSFNQGPSYDRWAPGPAIHYESGNDPLLAEQLSNVKRDYEALKARYAELSRLRNTEAEESLTEHRRLSEARDAAAERTIKSLQTENERLKRELAQARQEQASAAKGQEQAEAQDSVSTVIIQEKDEKISELQKLIKIYSGFSGLKIEVSEEDESSWNCSFSSRSGRFQFTLHHDSAFNRYQYLPSSSSSAMKSLPEFLMTDILIGADQMQMFFWRMLDSLTKK